MLSATLKSELLALGLYDNEPDAISAWAEVFDNYFQDAESNGIPVTPHSTVAAKAAMARAMTGLSTAGAAALAMAITAYWTSLATTPGAIFVSAIAITPPVLLMNIQRDLEIVFAANTAGSASKNVAMEAIAAVLHIDNQGGTATFRGPVVFPIL